MIKYLQQFIGLTALVLLETTVAAQPLTIRTDEVVVVYAAPLESAAAEVVRIYPHLKTLQVLQISYNKHCLPAGMSMNHFTVP